MFPIIIAILLAALRIAGHKSQIFQAIAHIFMGWLICSYVKSESKGTWWNRTDNLSIWIAIVLSVVEVACFIWFKVSEG